VRAGGFLSRQRSVAPAGWSRWLVPPAALSIHLAIGQVYAWSVFKVPLATTMLAGNPRAGVLTALPFTLGIIMLGLSAALFGTRVDARGPRWAMAVSSACFVSGLLVAALGVWAGWYWLVVVGYGVVGGTGLGIGYISPVSTLLRWFPDRPGTATGFAILGFGGGAVIAAPLTTQLLATFGGSGPAASASGVARTFLVLAVLYAVFMSMGWLLVRVPPEGWHPAGADPRGVPGARSARSVPAADVAVRDAVRTRQFWLLWVVLCCNVTAGIGILERAAPIYADFFPDAASPAALTAAAVGFVAMLSLANATGRILWSSTSDLLGRRTMYRLYLGVGALLYLTLTLTTNMNRVLFLVATLVILSFYGAGFATVPAYLRDLFGTYQVGAIHGRLLTAWSIAGVLGPYIVNTVADGRIAAGVAGPGRYTTSFMIMIGLLVVGFVANELIRPLARPEHQRPPTRAAETTGAPV